MTIYTYTRYRRSFDRLDPQIRKAAQARIAIFGSSGILVDRNEPLMA